MPVAIIYIAAVALFAGAMNLPDAGYYTLLRLIAFGIFIWVAFIAHTRGHEALPWVYGILALLFNPLLKIGLPKELWVIIDVCAGILLLVTKSAVQKKSAQEIADDKNYFAIADEELSENQKDQDIWAQALSKANGDKGKAEPKYIRMRVSVLKVHERQARQAQVEQAIACLTNEEITKKRAEAEALEQKLGKLEKQHSASRARITTFLFGVFTVMAFVGVDFISKLLFADESYMSDYIKERYLEYSDYTIWGKLFILCSIAWLVMMIISRMKRREIIKIRNRIIEKYSEFGYTWKAPKSVIDADAMKAVFLVTVPLIFLIPLLSQQAVYSVKNPGSEILMSSDIRKDKILVTNDSEFIRPGKNAYDLGKMYWQGDATDKNTRTAYHWYFKSVQTGNADAAFDLADMYYLGEFGNKDLVLSYAWLIQAERLGFKDKVLLNKAYSILDKEISEDNKNKAFNMSTYLVKDLPTLTMHQSKRQEEVPKAAILNWARTPSPSTEQETQENKEEDHSINTEPSSDMIRVQKKLSELGYYIGPTTGILDEETNIAIMRFQKGRGIAATGRPDFSTMRAMRLSQH